VLDILKKIVIVLLFILFSTINLTHTNADIFTFEDESISQSTVRIIDPFTDDVVQVFTLTGYEITTDILHFKQELEKWAHEFSKGINKKISYKKPMILDKIGKNGEVIKGRPLITVHEELLVEQIIQHAFSGGNIIIPLKYTESDYSQKDVPHLREVVLASYTTYFKAHNSGRSKNIELSAAAINNVIVGNDDVFSFNSVVGPRDLAAGYQVAPEIIKGKMVMGIGGGICQTSSTLFNAVDKLQVKILERHNHSRDVGYIPKGRDATVSFGGLDFVFQNTLGIPFLVRTYYQKGSITVQITTSREYEQILKKELM